MRPVDGHNAESMVVAIAECLAMVSHGTRAWQADEGKDPPYHAKDER